VGSQVEFEANCELDEGVDLAGVVGGLTGRCGVVDVAAPLHLSVGSPTLLRALERDPIVTVHLDSGTDVVLIEGKAWPGSVHGTVSSTIEAYNRKYDWDSHVAQYGPLSVVRTQRVLAWRTARWAGRDSFQTTGSWDFDSPL
jgi:hypothetical protein